MRLSGKRTVGQLWLRATTAGYADPAYLSRQDGAWHGMTWAEAAERVDLLAHGLLARGIRKGDVIGIFAQTALEWTLFDFALALVGGVTAPVYATGSGQDAAYILEHAEAIGVLVHDDSQLAKLTDVEVSLPRLLHRWTFADLDDLAEEGRAHRAASPGALAAAEAAVEEDDLYTFIYTSGTTGPPKGCMIRHRNYVEMIAVTDGLPSYLERGDLALLYLPLAHNFGRLVSLGGPYCGFTIAFEPDPYAISESLLQIRPTVFPSVPRVFEKIHATVVSAFAETTGVKRKLVDWALAVGREHGTRRMEGRAIPRSLALKHRLADRLVYSKVKARLGGRLRLPIAGGAPLGKEVAEFFDMLDIRIMEGYGLTECTSAATTNHPEAYRYGTVGTKLPGFELKLAEDGELLMRSETIFAGYFKEPEATAAVLDADGWLRSGDIATISDDGFVTITDRKKDILVTAGGKNIAPQNLENDLKVSRFISQAVVVGDRRPFAAALVTLDAAELARWAEAEGVEGDIAALATDPRVTALVQGEVDRVNAGRARYEQIKRFVILPRDFEMAQGEITPTLKLKRRVVLDHFAGAVEDLYRQ
ncbi:MAG: long-chain fatty acid--CoA ligase [Gaiellales bacterium]